MCTVRTVRSFFCLFCKRTSQTKGKGDRKRPQEGATPHPSTDDGRCWLNRRAAHPARLSAAAVGCCCCCCCSLPHRYSPLLCALYRLSHSQSILWKPQKRKRPTQSLWHLFFSFSFLCCALLFLWSYRRWKRWGHNVCYLTDRSSINDQSPPRLKK